MSTEPPDDRSGREVDPSGEDGSGEMLSTAVRAKRARMDPSAVERELHEATGHVVFRSWCGHCVGGRGHQSPHITRDHADDSVPVIAWDNGFLSSSASDYAE